MKIKTSELTGPALDWAVALAAGYLQAGSSGYCVLIPNAGPVALPMRAWSPTTRWAQGGPIIEREVIALIHPKYDCWTAHVYDKRVDDESYTLDGPTPLIAAMRCYVASHLGDEVEVPEGL